MSHLMTLSAALRRARLCLALVLSLLVGSVSAQNDPLLGTFSDGWFTMTIGGGGGQYQGRIDVGGQTYPFTGQGNATRIDGLYTADGQQYQFAAMLQGEALTFWNTTQTFQLTRQGAAPAQGPVGVQTAPQPAAAGYLTPGTRFTYEHAVASNPGTNAGPNAQAVGGRGYIEIEIVHSDAQLCVATLSMYTYGMTVNALTRTGGDIIVGEGGICSTYWAHPSLLADYQAPAGGIQTVQRGPFEHGGRSYNAISIASEYQNIRMTRVYDLASGFLLTEVEGMGERGFSTGGNQQAAGSGVQSLINVRQVSLPWSHAGPLPENVRGLSELNYRGEIVTSVPGIFMWDSSLASKAEVKLVVQQRGANYLLVQNTTNMTFPGSDIAQPPITIQGLITPVSGHFIPVSAIPNLSAGQVLDSDPVTGIRTIVERVDANGVVIVNEGTGTRSVSTYDARTGLMVYNTLERAGDGQNFNSRQELVGAQ
ncbi:MAG: hypothetical protein KF813_13235 [Trueperaceae bacterium]|nr:hypothetical protein [Trueperaceae bacterium]